VRERIGRGDRLPVHDLASAGRPAQGFTRRIAILTDGRRLPVSRAGYTRLSGLLNN
jgi:hypothetical protein